MATATAKARQLNRGISNILTFRKDPLAFLTRLARDHGDVVSYRTCGGGGYGPPQERNPQSVLRDIVQGKVSAERAREDYGIAMDSPPEPEGGDLLFRNPT